MSASAGAIMQFLSGAAEASAAVAEGYAARTQARYNIAMLEGQMALLDIAKKEVTGQMTRNRGRFMSKFTSAVAGSGLMISGSAKAVALGAVTEMMRDQALSDYDFALKRNELETAKHWEHIKGKRAVRAGWMQGYTKMMRAGANFMSSQQRVQTRTPSGGGGRTSTYSNQYASRQSVGGNPYARGTTAGAQKAMIRF